MTLLQQVQPPLNDVALLGSNPLRVYVIMFESAAMDNRYDKRTHLPWHERRDCGGTTSWTIKGLANELGIKRDTVSRALNKLLDAGYIQIAGEQENKGNSRNTVWRVTHPQMLEAVRYSIELMGPPSERLKKMRTKQQKVDTSKYYELPATIDF